jgi:arsenical resistance protein ArsH
MVRRHGVVLAGTSWLNEFNFKSQIDWIPLAGGAIRATQGKTLALMQVSGGSQSFNSLNQMRILGRWMRMITIPNQSSIPKAFLEFEEDGRMKPSAFYDRIVDVMEELYKFTYSLAGKVSTSQTVIQSEKSLLKNYPSVSINVVYKF